MQDNKLTTYFPYQSHFVDVFGAKMHYIEQGQGTPILFLHGIPTSAYLWRNVIPHLSGLGRCIAVDLIGMGKSDKPDIEYTIEDHIKYINKFIETLNLKRLILVMHGWGSIIGFHYAMQHETNCRGLVFYEAYLRSLDGEELSLPYQEQLQEWGTEEYTSMMNGVDFVDKILTQGMLNYPQQTEIKYYHEPFLLKGSSKPLSQYIQELQNIHNNNQLNKIINDYSKQLQQSNLPKLMLYSVPGFITTIATIMWAKEHLKNLEIVDIGEELHFAQESHPRLMGEVISVWLQGLK